MDCEDITYIGYYCCGKINSIVEILPNQFTFEIIAKRGYLVIFSHKEIDIIVGWKHIYWKAKHSGDRQRQLHKMDKPITKWLAVAGDSFSKNIFDKSIRRSDRQPVRSSVLRW